MKLTQIAGAAVLAASLVGASGLAAQAAPAKADKRSCFFASQWSGWSSPSPDVLLLRVNSRDVYRVDLVGNRQQLKRSGQYLVSRVSGGGSVCSALDLQLSVADDHGFQKPLFPRNLTRLTPEEVKAIPRQYRP